MNIAIDFFVLNIQLICIFTKKSFIPYLPACTFSHVESRKEIYVLVCYRQESSVLKRMLNDD